MAGEWLNFGPIGVLAAWVQVVFQGQTKRNPAGPGDSIGVGKAGWSDCIDQAGLRWCPGFGE